jgi:hypothetical protein
MICKAGSASLFMTQFLGSLICIAQSSVPITPLQLAGTPQVTKAPPFSGVSDSQCNDIGTIYAHYVTRQADSFSFSSGVTKIESDGTVERIPIEELPDSGPIHVFQFAAGEDGSLHEIVRARKFDSPDAPTNVYYVTFDSDGAFHSKEPFEKEFIPSLLLPLPDGGFFAAGVTLEETQDEVNETPMSGIFGPDAKLRWPLQKTKQKSPVSSGSKDAPEGGEEASLQATAAVLGADGNIYILFDGEETRVKVITRTGRLVRNLQLHSPFELGISTGMWVSGGRILVTYEGESDDPKSAQLYALYEAQTGQNVRLYRPDFSGNLVCFQEGQSITVIMPERGSGAVELGDAELQ